MTRRIFSGILVAVVVALGPGIPGDAREVVSIVLHGKYFAEPATVRFMVAVEPDRENRILRIEADSNDMFRASEITLNGANEKRLHTVTFKNLAAGHYRLRASVMSTSQVRGTAEDNMVVTGIGLR